KNILHLLDCISNFGTKAPDACCVYTPLTSSNLSDVITGYTPDVQAKSTLFADYLSGMSCIHDQKGIMHRDISPGNLAITSFNKPRGVIIDLDAATTDATSRDHMKGTLPLLAPEIIAFKFWKGTGSPPAPYDKSVDTWALGLVMYALYTGHIFNWATYGATPQRGYSVATVTAKAYAAFEKQLSKLGQSVDTRLALDLIAAMTAWDGEDRTRISDALQGLKDARTSQDVGMTVPKENRKRPWGEN
ncbi:MAG: hypothetical protein Q9196_007366, partial [Gyalolechia fulgens]